MAIACDRFNCALTPRVTGGHRSGGCVKVDVFEREHRNQFFLGTSRESAALYEFSGVLVGSEHSIPERNIAEVIFMDVELMMYRMQFGRLNQVSEPMRCSHIGVIKIFSSASEEVVPERPHQRTTEQRVQDDGAENGI